MRDKDSSVDASAFRLNVNEGEFQALGALFRKGANLDAPAEFNFLDERSGLQGTNIPSPGVDHFRAANDLFVASIDDKKAITCAKEALTQAKRAGALCLLVVPVDNSQPLILDSEMRTAMIGPEADCVIYVPGQNAATALLTVMTRCCAGIAEQYVIAVDFNDLRIVLGSGGTGVLVSANGKSPDDVFAALIDETNETLSRLSGLAPDAIKGDLLCVCLDTTDQSRVISVIGLHLKMTSHSNASMLYNPGYWPTSPMHGNNDLFVSRIVNW